MVLNGSRSAGSSSGKGKEVVRPSASIGSLSRNISVKFSDGCSYTIPYSSDIALQIPDTEAKRFEADVSEAETILLNTFTALRDRDLKDCLQEAAAFDKNLTLVFSERIFREHRGPAAIFGKISIKSVDRSLRAVAHFMEDFMAKHEHEGRFTIGYDDLTDLYYTSFGSATQKALPNDLQTCLLGEHTADCANECPTCVESKHTLTALTYVCAWPFQTMSNALDREFRNLKSRNTNAVSTIPIFKTMTERLSALEKVDSALNFLRDRVELMRKQHLTIPEESPPHYELEKNRPTSPLGDSTFKDPLPDW